MILILKGADFSAKNLGQVEFTAELTEETLAIMNKATKYPQDKENQYAQALNSLISGLVNAGIYDKISTLVVPVMSSTIAECGYNQKTGAANPNPTYFANLFGLREDGTLERKAYEFTNTNQHCGHLISHTYGDFSLFGIYQNNVGGSYTFQTDIIGTYINGFYGLSDAITYIGGPVGRVLIGNSISLNANNDSILINKNPVSTPFVASFDGLSTSYIDRRGSFSGSVASVSQSGGLYRLYPVLCGARNSQSQGSMLIYGCGSKLTSAEMATAYSLLYNFAVAFGQVY